MIQTNEAKQKRLEREVGSRRWTLVKNLKWFIWCLMFTAFATVAFNFEAAGTYVGFASAAVALALGTIGTIAGFDSAKKPNRDVE